MSTPHEMTDDQRMAYDHQGFLHMPGVIPAPLVRELRGSFDEAAEAYHGRWREDAAGGKAARAYFDVPNILDRGDCFVDLVDLPSVLPVLLEAVGPDIQLNHTHARVFPPGKTFTAPWHSDLANVVGVNLAQSPNFFAKVHFYFEDLRPDQGCLAFIPGSHRLPAGHPRPAIHDLEHSPAVRRVVPKAGDAVLFNTHVLHMALDNTSPLPRKSLIYAYSHTWVKNYANAIPSDLDRYATTHLRRQLFGVEDEGVSFFDQRYDSNIAPDNYGTFQSASLRVLRRLRRATSITR